MVVDPLFVIAIITLLPAVLLTVFRVNAAVAFLALCLGSVLGSFVADALVDVLRGFIAPASDVTDAIVRLVLLWLPVVLVLFFMAGTIGYKQRIINLLPALGVGVVGVLLSVPFLTVGWQVSIGASEVWAWLYKYQALIVIFATISSLLLLRMRKPFHEHHGAKRHH